MAIYDKNVGETIDSWVGGHGDVDAHEIAEFAINNQDRYGTEAQFVLRAIEDFYEIFEDNHLI